MSLFGHQLCCVIKCFPGEIKNTHLLTPRRELKIDQSTDTTKAQLGEPMCFLGVTCRNMDGCLHEHECLKDSCITQARPSMGDGSLPWEPGADCTAYRQLHRLGSALSRCLGWSKALSGSWAGPESSLLLVLLFLAGWSLVNLVSFRDFLKLLFC